MTAKLRKKPAAEGRAKLRRLRRKLRSTSAMPAGTMTKNSHRASSVETARCAGERPGAMPSISHGALNAPSTATAASPAPTIFTA